jgi:hypothetical protein
VTVLWVQMPSGEWEVAVEWALRTNPQALVASRFWEKLLVSFLRIWWVMTVPAEIGNGGGTLWEQLSAIKDAEKQQSEGRESTLEVSIRVQGYGQGQRCLVRYNWNTFG